MCKCRQQTNPAASGQRVGSNLSQEINNMNDQDMILVQYTHPNRGKHPVVGMRTGRSYGYRGGGEQFLAHKADIAAQPHYYKALEGRRPEPVKTVAPPPPPPPKVVEVAIPAPPQIKKSFEKAASTEDVAVEMSPPEDIQDSILPLNLSLIPGVTPGVESAMTKAGLTTRTAITEAGIEGLKKIRLIGPSRADIIYRYARGDFDEEG